MRTLQANILACRLALAASRFKPAACSLQRAAICSIFVLFAAWICCFAQGNDRIVELTKQIIEAKNNEGLYMPFEALKEIYLKENKYTEFVDFLKSLESKNKTISPFTNYYIALTRYNQLKYLEENQIWDEYFAQGNTYREQITQAAKNAIDATKDTQALNIYSRLVLWQFHKDQQDVFAETSLSDLISSVKEYAKSAQDPKPIKEAADKLLSYAEKGKSKELYRVYADKIVSANTKDDQLAAIAQSFYKEGNLELSQDIYDAYIDRITKALPRERFIPILIGIAQEFAYKEEGPIDMLYAETIFKKIEELGGKEALGEEQAYLRAFNLEKAKEYSQARDLYVEFLTRFPDTKYADALNFKVGLIYTYVLRDKKTGKSYFEKLAQKQGGVSSQLISGLYQLGLLSQWENDAAAAKDFYNKLIEKAGTNFPETVIQAKERLKETEEAKEIDYNLKTFLDVSLKEQNFAFDMTKLDLKAHPYQAKKDEEININSSAYTAPSGCMQIELQYLWSGDTGSVKPAVSAASFNTAYTEPGTKVINLVVVSPTGILDRSMDIIDIQ